MAQTEEQAYISHPLLTEDIVERRLYQLRLAGSAMEDHTLVCLPTGLGKTTVSLLVTARRLDEVGGTSLLLAPTKPLVEQHAEFYREALTIPDEEIVVFTGEVRPDDRAGLWDEATVVIATPQVIENDLIGSRISLAEVTHCTFDECHRGTGDYAYTYIAERYHQQAEDPLVTGMTASPGGDREAIRTVCANLGIRQVEVMTEDDADVDAFTHETDIEWETVAVPEEIQAIRDAIADVIEDRLEDLRDLGVTGKRSAEISQRELNELRGKLQNLMDADDGAGFKGMSLHAEIMKLKRALEVVETQSVAALRRYFERQRQAARSSGASKASQRLVSDPRVREAMRKAEDYDGRHPKFERARARLAETLGIDGGSRAIVFTESRDTAEILTEFLGESFDVERFVGQGDKEGSDGMTQAEQQETLEAFKDGDFEVLVSTSVAEEGLDVPEVDLVLFYEPVPTAIRSIQRKGRTGRQSRGAVVVLMAEDTRDEAYFWIARRRESEMEEELQELKAMQSALTAELQQTALDGYDDGSGVATSSRDPDVAGRAPAQSTDSGNGSQGSDTAEEVPDVNEGLSNVEDEDQDTSTEPTDSTAANDAVGDGDREGAGDSASTESSEAGDKQPSLGTFADADAVDADSGSTGESSADSGTEEVTDADADEATDSDVDEATNPEGDEATEPGDDEATDSDVDEATDLEGDEVTDPGDDEATDSDVDEATDLEGDEVTDPGDDEATDSDVDEATDLEGDEVTEPGDDEATDSDVDEATDLEGDEVTEPGDDEATDSDVDEATNGTTEETALSPSEASAVADDVTTADDIAVIVDQRELDSIIARDLSKREAVETRLETLAVGDYLCSDRVAIERKTVSDFLDTLLGEERSLFEQARGLTEAYPRSVIVIEGRDLYDRRNVHPNAIRGAIASLATDFGLSILQTADAEETTELIEAIASREQDESGREISVHGEKQTKTLAEQQEYVVGSIAEIGPVTARSLLAAFGSVEDVMTASREELLAVEGVGEVTADRIREVVGSGYEG